MSVFAAPDFDKHEKILFGHDDATGLRAIIAIHNTSRGPGVGGMRMWPYADEAAAIADALRLSRGMTYKSALADLPVGGGKSVIIGDARRDKTPELMRAMGRLVDRLGGQYVGAEDVGTTVADMDLMATVTRHIAGTSAAGGDPSPLTAYGVFEGIRAAVNHRLRRNDDLDGVNVAIQGLGAVGYDLARRLAAAGARLKVADLRDEAVMRAADEFAAAPVAVDAIHAAEVDVYAPCALGAVVNDATVDQIAATIVAGSANNQLAEDRHGTALARRAITYAPDYVINAGGIVDVAYGAGFMGPHDEADVYAHIGGIYVTLGEIFARADAADEATNVIADRMAEERFATYAAAA